MSSKRGSRRRVQTTNLIVDKVGGKECKLIAPYVAK
jgi:hypothetical protein